MLYSKLTECTACTNITELICEIDEKLLFYAKNTYNNLTLLTTLKVDKENIQNLLRYKRILNIKRFNPCYANSVDFADIVSRVKILLNK